MAGGSHRPHAGAITPACEVDVGAAQAGHGEDGEDGLGDLGFLDEAVEGGAQGESTFRLLRCGAGLPPRPRLRAPTAAGRRRPACPAAGSAEAKAAGLALDQSNPDHSGSLPPYGASNYCADTAIQFYGATLRPLGQNIRLSAHALDPQLNSPSESATGNPTFLGDYFGNTIAATGTSQFDYTTSVTTYDDGTNRPTASSNWSPRSLPPEAAPRSRQRPLESPGGTTPGARPGLARPDRSPATAGGLPRA